MDNRMDANIYQNNFVVGDLKAWDDLKADKLTRWRVREKKRQMALEDVSFWTYFHYQWCFIHSFLGSNHNLQHYLNHVNNRLVKDPSTWDQQVLDSWRPLIKNKDDPDQELKDEDFKKIKLRVADFSISETIFSLVKVFVALYITLNLPNYLSSEIFMSPEFQKKPYVYKWVSVSIFSGVTRYRIL
eukprot:UN32250